MRMVEDVMTNMGNRKKTCIIDIDVQNAFDKIWQEVLIAKMVQREFSKTNIRLRQDYLALRALG